MSIKFKFIFYFFIIFLIVGLASGYSIWAINVVDKYLKSELPTAIIQVQNSSKLDVVAQLIRYDDEVLTQSARNYAFTGNREWKDRYDEFVPKLDLRIKEAVEEASEEEKVIFSEIESANLMLIDLESQAFNFADQGDLFSAQAVLEGEEYARQKEIYKKGIEKYLAKRGASLDSANAVSAQAIENVQQGLHDLIHRSNFLIAGLVVVFFLTMVFTIYLIVKTFMLPLFIFKRVAKEITGGNLNATVNVKSKDEIGEFAVDFNKMTASLKDSIENTEKKVKERTQELEKLNNFMVGRELKMIELKQKIEKLQNKKEDQKYAI